MTQVTYGAQDPISCPFQYEVPLTGFAIAAYASFLHLNPAGTLATGAVTLPLNPADGQCFGIISTQTQTAITITANTGDTIANTVTALVALTPVWWRYHLATRTWRRTG